MTEEEQASLIERIDSTEASLLRKIDSLGERLVELREEIRGFDSGQSEDGLKQGCPRREVGDAPADPSAARLRELEKAIRELLEHLRADITRCGHGACRRIGTFSHTLYPGGSMRVCEGCRSKEDLALPLQQVLDKVRGLLTPTDPVHCPTTEMPSEAVAPKRGPTLFLDIDFVLNSYEFFKTPLPANARYPRLLDPKAIAELNRIVEQTGCEVVISSDKRLGHSLETMTGWLLIAGFTGRITGTTKVFDENGKTDRHVEVEHWLDTSNGWSRPHLALDDDFGPHGRVNVLFVDPDFGLTASLADKAIEMLKQKVELDR